MSYRVLLLATLALTMFVGANPLPANDAEEITKVGKIVSVFGDRLVMTDSERKDGKSYGRTAAADAEVTCDAKPCKTSDLRPGMRIRVTTSIAIPSIATRIEALDKNETFANTRDGKLASVTGDSLLMTNLEGLERSHTFTLAADTKVTCDGKPCKASDLKAGMRIRVTTETRDQIVVIQIEALDKTNDFAQI